MNQSFKINYTARRDEETGKLYKNITNYGLKCGQSAILLRNGEYFQFGIQAMEDIPPLLTDYTINYILKKLNENDITSIINYLCLKYTSDLLNIILGLINYVFIKNDIDVPENLKCEYKLDDKLKLYASSVSHDPINYKIKINSIGSHNDLSVVPEEWLFKEFNNAYELHNKMNSLDNRIGKPKVTYCCIYSMTIVENNNNIIQINDKPKYVFSLSFDNNKFSIHITTHLLDNFNYSKIYTKSNDLIIFGHNNIFTNSKNYIKSENVGVLVSRLQKCIRRGGTVKNLLVKTINDLLKSAPYCLPEHQFIRVSPTRQLLWRLYISTIEDARPWKSDDDELKMFYLIIMTIITHLNVDITLTEQVKNVIIDYAIMIQSDNELWKWRDGDNNYDKKLKITSLSVKNSLILALHTMPMMHNDSEMLKKSINYLATHKPYKLSKPIKNINNDDDEYDAILESYDMHCNPNIILYLQSSLEKRITTNDISHFIWNISSSYNFRRHTSKPEKNEQLRHIQEYLYKKSLKNLEKCNVDFNISSEKLEITNCDIPTNIAKLAFLSLFGITQYISLKKKSEVIFNNEFKVKQAYTNIHKYIDVTDKEMIIIKEHYKKGISIRLPFPPIGFKWTIHNNNVIIKIIDDKFYVNDNEIYNNDASKLLVYNKINEIDMTDDIKECVMKCFKFNDFLNNIKMLEISNIRRSRNDMHVYNWNIDKINDEILIIIKCAITKINMADNCIYIGPVDRRGGKLNKSINYYYEGKIWSVFCMLSMLYPNVLESVGINFKLNKYVFQYNNLILKLENIIKNFEIKKNEHESNEIATIKTILWDHQKNTVNKITNGYMDGYRGFGDASTTGSGKTLSALAIMANLTKNENNNSFVILLPNAQLIKTWKDEIIKHTLNFHILIQESNGKISDVIKNNSILLTTLGRMREHPIINKWTLIIIDECLTVQNENALWTEEACKQVINSKHGVLMLSATFFRCKFEKLFFMLKMLQTGYPMSKEYLNIILDTTMICNYTDGKVWKTETLYTNMSHDMAKKYEMIKQSTSDQKSMYIKLNNLLFEHDYTEFFINTLKKLNNEKRRVLLYVDGIDRANNIYDNLKNKINISRFSDIGGINCIAATSEALYGVNNLTDYDTILTYPIEPDKLPQMKGRLDRPSQKNNLLYLYFYVVKDSLHDLSLQKIDMANNFYGQYIMPIAKKY